MNGDLIPKAGDPASALAGFRPQARLVDVQITEAAHAVGLAWTVDQQRLAIHEAGHSVALARVGRSVETVSIKGGHRSTGGHTESDEDVDTRPSFRTARELRDLITVDMAGLEAELAILGEAADGNTSDFRNATRRAMVIVNNGLAAGIVPVALDEIHSYANPPQRAMDDRYEFAVAEVSAGRERAASLVAENRDANLGFAVRLFDARRMDGEQVDDALRSVGIEPPVRLP